MITYYFRTIKDAELKKIDGPRNGVWIHVETPTKDELVEIAEQLKLEQSILEDALDFFEVPRLELDNDTTYFFTRYPFKEQTEDIDTAPLLIVVGETFVMTVAQRPVLQIEPLLNGKVPIITTQKTKLFIEIMKVVTQSFERQLTGLRRSVNKDRVKLREISNQEILRFVNYEHKLNDMVAAVMPTNVAIQHILGGHYIKIFEEDKELIEDIRIDNFQIIESAKILLKTIQNVRNAAEAILTNNLNSRIKTLTVLTILLTIPTVISSLYGMNLELPLADSDYAFEFVITVVISAVGFGVWYFKKNDWL